MKYGINKYKRYNSIYISTRESASGCFSALSIFPTLKSTLKISWAAAAAGLLLLLLLLLDVVVVVVVATAEGLLGLLLLLLL